LTDDVLANVVVPGKAGIAEMGGMSGKVPDKASDKRREFWSLKLPGSFSDLLEMPEGRFFGFGIDNGAVKIGKVLLKKAASSLGKEGVQLAFQVGDTDLIWDSLKVVLVNANESGFKIGNKPGQWIANFGNKLKKEVANAFNCLCVQDDKVRNVLGGKVNCEEEHKLFSLGPDDLAVDAAKAAPIGGKFGSDFLSIFAVFSQLMEKGENPAVIDVRL
jgi:hypothetical protein